MAAIEKFRSKTGKVLVKATEEYVEPLVTDEEIRRMKSARLVEEHLPPIGLTMVVILCSGTLLVLSLRDFLTTGKNIGGTWDEAMLEYTKSTQWYEGSKGWMSTQGGFSAVMPVTTDQNNMGGFFVRKLCGAAGVAVHLQKLMPLFMHEPGAQWKMGHFRTLLSTAVLANAAIAAFYGMYFDDLTVAGVTKLPLFILSVLAVETLTILMYLLSSPKSKLGYATALPAGKVPSSCPSNIVRNTCLLITTFFSILAFRDLFLTGYILDWLPRDDIYLEWTNALLHSPPNGTFEAAAHGLEAPLYIGDKFVCQLAALHILINSTYKFVSSIGLSYKSDGSGLIKARMIWKTQAIGSVLVFSVYRVFTQAASSASYDMRWHLMLLVYETLILGFFGFL